MIRSVSIGYGAFGAVDFGNKRRIDGGDGYACRVSTDACEISGATFVSQCFKRLGF